MTAHAALSPLPDRASLGEPFQTWLYEWEESGNPSDIVASPFKTPTYNELTLSTRNGGPFQIFELGNGWDGNFAPGAILLTAPESGFAIGFRFPITGIGFQVQPGLQYIGTFDVTVEAVDSLGSSLGSLTFSGESTADADDSALFVGFRNDVASRISTLWITVDAAGADRIAINTLTIRDTDGYTYIPESAASRGAWAGAVLLALFSNRRNRPQPLKPG